MMFFNKFKRLRKKISKDTYHKDRLWKLAEELEDLNFFQDFECNSFFRGELKAKLNQEIYDKKYNRLTKKAEWYEKKLLI